MEAHIDVDKVDRVLRPDGWHQVRDASFTVASVACPLTAVLAVGSSASP